MTEKEATPVAEAPRAAEAEGGIAIARTREALTHDRIILAALHIMDEEGLEAVTMRRVGRELGVEAMSLYNHVRDKEDILDGISERVMSEFRFPPEHEDWVDTARAAAREWRRLLRMHPNVIRLLAERHKPMQSIDGLRPMEFALNCLRRAGLDARDGVQAFHAFGGYIMGFVMMETGLLFGVTDEDHRLMHQELTTMLVAAGMPRVVECMDHMGDVSSDEQFEFGLDLMIRGLQAKLSGSP